MATSLEYIQFVCENISDFGNIRYRKMFGEYMVYIDDKPILSVCDNTVFVKKLPEIARLMKSCKCGYPYDGAKECYILDVEDSELVAKLIPVLCEVIPFPKSKKVK